jgi:hypothetical protein
MLSTWITAAQNPNFLEQIGVQTCMHVNILWGFLPHFISTSQTQRVINGHYCHMRQYFIWHFRPFYRTRPQQCMALALSKEWHVWCSLNPQNCLVSSVTFWRKYAIQAGYRPINWTSKVETCTDTLYGWVLL